MTLLQKINCFAIGLPIILAALAVFELAMLYFALLSTVVTGFLQVSIGLCLLIKHYKNRHLHTYFFLCFLFFSLVYKTDWGVDLVHAHIFSNLYDGHFALHSYRKATMKLPYITHIISSNY